MKKIISQIILTIALLIVAFLPACKKEPSRIETSEALITPVDFLSDYKFKSLTIEIVYEHGLSPSPETINNLRLFLASRLFKPGNILVNSREISGSDKSSISLSDISEIERKNRSAYSKNNSLTCFVYLSNSDYSGDSGNNKTLGISYASTSIVLFGKTMLSLSGGVAQPSYSVLETTVAEHEFGHLMGLVNKGTGMTSLHLDAAHGKHCSNSKCLTYYLVETSDVVSNLTGGTIPLLDSNCIRDLQRNGGK